MASVYFVFFRGGGAPAAPENRIVVLPFENLTGDPELDELGAAAAHWITDGLGRASEVRVVATNNVLQLLRVREEGVTDQEIAASLGAGTVVSGVRTRQESDLDFRAQIVDLATGEVLYSVEASGVVDRPMVVVEALRQQVMGALALSLDRVFAEAVYRTPSYEAYQAMARGVEEFAVRDHAGALPHFLRAYQLDTTFLAPLFWAITTSRNQGDPAAADSLVNIVEPRKGELTPVERLQFDWIAAVDRQGELGALRALSEENPSFYGYDLGNTALHAGRPEEAFRALERVDLDHPYWGRFPRVWRAIVSANQQTGRSLEALETARRGRERFPEDLELRRLEIRILVTMGRLDEIGPVLDAIGSMEPEGGQSPGSVFRNLSADLARLEHSVDSRMLAERALDWYQTRDPEGYQQSKARALLLIDRPEEALALIIPLVEESSESLTNHGLHGIALALTGDLEGAEAEARWCEALDRPFLGGSNTYWRTAILAHLGRREEAVRLLRQALQEGLSYRDRSFDPNFRRLWGYEPFEQLIAPKG